MASGRLSVPLLTVLAFSANAPLWAAKVDITPSLVVEEVYTDNVGLTDSETQEDLVSRIVPAVSVRAQGRRLNLNFTGRMEALEYARDTRNDGINLQFNGAASAELMPQILFLDVNLSRRQENQNNRIGQAVDNISGADNRVSVTTFEVTPIIRHHFGTFADTETRLSLSQVDSSDSSSLSTQNQYNMQSRFTSGRRFRTVSWQLELNRREGQRSGNSGSDTDFQSIRASAAYRLSSEWRLLLNAGDEDNEFTGSNQNDSGSFYTVGAQWVPGRRFSLGVNLGNDRNGFNTSWNPSLRTSMTFSYEKRDSGTERGDVFSFDLSHRTRRLVLSARYRERTTTTQELLLQPQTISGIDPTTLQPIDIQALLPTLTDEVLTQQRFDVNASYNRARHTFTLSPFHVVRDFRVSGDQETDIGINGSWSWRYSARTTTRVSLRYSELEPQVGSTNERYDLTLELRRAVTAQADALIRYLYRDTQSDDANTAFTENRLTASINYAF